jgi:hypothetical protein
LIPSEFYYPSLFVFDPATTFPTLNLVCDECGGKLNCRAWPDNARKVIGIDEVYYVYSRRYECKNAAKKDGSCKRQSQSMLAHDPMILAQCRRLNETFPAVLSKKSGLDKQLLRMMISVYEHGFTWEQAAHTIRELHCERYWRLHLRYLLVWKDLLPTLSKSDGLRNYFQSDKSLTGPEIAMLIKIIPSFSKFDDCEGYCGYLVSGKAIFLIISINYCRK